MSFAESLFTVYFSEHDLPSAAVRQIQSFAKFTQGWCFGRGQIFSSATITQASFVAGLLEVNRWEVEAYPGEEGQILVSGRIGDTILKIEVQPSSEFVVRVKNGDEETDEKTVSMSDIFPLISQQAHLCDTSDSFSQHGGARGTTNLLITHSNLQARPSAAGSRLSKRTAPKITADAHAHTSENFVEMISVRPSFFGPSIAKFSQAAP